MHFYSSDDIEKMAARQDLDGLRSLIRHPDKATRLAAALALAEMNESEGWSCLIDAARQQDDPELQIEAVTLLSDLNPQRVIPVFEEILKHASKGTAGVIMEALEAMSGSEAGEALRRAGYEPVLPHMSGNLQLMEYEGKYVRSILPNTPQVEFLTAEEHLNQAADLSEADLTEHALVEDSLALWLAPKWADAWFQRGRLFEDLERYFEAGLCYKSALEFDPNLAKAQEALDALEIEYAFPALDLDSLLSSLGSLEWSERRDSAARVGKMGENAPEQAVDQLIGLLRDEDREVRHAAIEAIARTGDSRAVQPLLAVKESSWLLRFAILEALSQLGAVSGLTTMLRREMNQVQERNPIFSSQKDPLLEVEYARLMEIGVLAYERTGDTEDLLTLAEGNAWVDVPENLDEGESDSSAIDEEEADDTEDLESYVDEVAQMGSLALERLALPKLASLDKTVLQRLAAVPDLTLLDLSDPQDGDAQPAIVHDLSGLREAAKAELAKR